MNKELELEAEKYAESQKMEGFDSQMRRDTFTRYSLEVAYKKGATSKYVEKQKLEFAIEQLKSLREVHDETVMSERVKKAIRDLEQKLSEL